MVPHDSEVLISPLCKCIAPRSPFHHPPCDQRHAQVSPSPRCTVPWRSQNVEMEATASRNAPDANCVFEVPALDSLLVRSPKLVIPAPASGGALGTSWPRMLGTNCCH